MSEFVCVNLPWYPPELQPNARVHHYAKAKVAATTKIHGWTCAFATRDEFKGKQGNIALNLTFCPPDKRHRDLDNCLASCKALLDGVAQAWGVNDTQFRPITIDFGDVVKGGEIIVQAAIAGGA